MNLKKYSVRFAVSVSIFLAGLAANLFAQTSRVRVEFFVQPFPSPYVSDWQTNPSIATLNLVNTGTIPQLVLITLRVMTGDGREVISGRSSPTQLLPGSNLLNNTSLLHGQLQYNDQGIKNQLVQTGRIPEGSYTACIDVEDMAGAALVTNECREFAIVYPDPPQLVYPMDGDSINTNYPILQWTPIQVPIQYQVHYVLNMVQLLQGQNPVQALAANVPQYTNNNLMTTSLQYPLSALPLVAGGTYVWQVQALDQNGFPPASNNGKSQIWTFRYQSHAIFPRLPIIPTGPLIHPVKPTPYTTTTISGTMYGTFSLPLSKPFGMHKTKFGYSMAGGTSISAGPPPAPLANAPLELIDEFVFVGPYNPATKSILEMVPPAYEQFGEPVATTTTDADGNFAFNFAQTQPSPDTLSSNYQQTLSNGQIITGTLVNEYRVVVEDQHYCSPDYDIAVSSGQTIDIGKQYALIRSFSLNVKLNPVAFGGTPGQSLALPNALQGYPVYILRQSVPQGVPADEGYPLRDSSQTIQGMMVVAKAMTDTSGSATFSDLVQNYGPNDEYYIYTAPPVQSSYSYETQTDQPTSFQIGMGESPSQYVQAAGYQVSPANWPALSYFNSEYTPGTVSVSQIMYATPGTTVGYVYRSDNRGSPVQSAQVSDLSSYHNGRFEYTTLTDGDGYFSLGAVHLMFSAAGFIDTTITVNGGTPLEVGQQASLPQIFLTPAYTATGTVVDEQGNPVQAKVWIGQGGAVDANDKRVETFKLIGNHVVEAWETANSGFEAPCVPGSQQIIIDASYFSGGTYFSDTENVDITYSGQNLGTFVLKKQTHRIKLIVTSGGVAVPGAHVRIQGVWNTATDNSGVADTVFDNTSDNFQITVTAPDGKNYVGQTINAYVPDSRDWTVINDTLSPATYISGTVKVGSTPIAGADVFMDQQSSSDLLQVIAKTDSTGHYILRDVPFGTWKIDAAKSESDIVGADTTILVTRSGLFRKGNGIGFRAAENICNFNLTVYNGMDITKLLGFPMEVVSLSQSASGVVISGDIKDPPSNKVFELAPADSDISFPFTNVVIDSGSLKDSVGLPYAVPRSLPLVTGRASMHLVIYGSFDAAQQNGGGITIDSLGSGGVIIGQAYIDPTTFTSANFAGMTLPKMYLGLRGAGNAQARLQVPTLTSSGALPIGVRAGYLLSDGNGNSIKDSLYGFTAIVDSSLSTVYEDTVKLATIIHSNIANLPKPDIDLDIGDVVLHKNGPDPIVGSKPIRIAIEKWTLEGDSWSITENRGFMIDSGSVNTGYMDIPFTGLQVTSTAFQPGTFEPGSMSLSGILPLNVSGTIDFGYDSGQRHWKFSIGPDRGNPAGYITGLPGAAPADSISIGNFYVMSDSTEGFTVSPTSLSLYKVANFTTSTLTPYPTYVEVSGSLNLHIPGLPAQTADIDYTRHDGILVSSIKKFPVNIQNNNGVTLAFAADSSEAETLDSTGFSAIGTVSENGVFNFHSKLIETTDSISIRTVSGQQFNLSHGGSGVLSNVAGTMRVNGSQWTNFAFSGDLTGEKNVSGHLNFIVYGDLIDSNATININATSSPFGGLQLTYDSQTGALQGSLYANDSIDGSAGFSAQLNMTIDNQGWFFFGGGNFSISKIKLELALLFGSHPMNSAMKDDVETWSEYYTKIKSLPPVFPDSLSGFYFEGDGQLGIPGLSASVNLVVVQASVGIALGGDFMFAMTIGNSPSNSLGSMGYCLWADATASAAVDIGVACAGAKGEITLWLNAFAKQLPVPPNWDWEAIGSVDLTLKAFAYAGAATDLVNDAGGCFPNCETDSTCSVQGDTVSALLGVTAWFGSDSSGVSYTLNGKASGN